MSNWEIIKQTSVQGVVEYCVSDGQVGERTFSWDFSTLKEAKEWLKETIERQDEEKFAIQQRDNFVNMMKIKREDDK